VFSVDVTAEVSIGAEEAFARLADFGSYGSHCELIDSVAVLENGDGAKLSEWLVRFREGVVHWVERDDIDPVERTIGFVQTKGDFAALEGRWLVNGSKRRARVDFHADVDIGMPALDELLDPLAQDALSDSVVSVVRGLLDREADVSAGPETLGVT
jgi:ribosome-associated toxin RatA of RatAB toxin-antitoxin module